MLASRAGLSISLAPSVAPSIRDAVPNTNYTFITSHSSTKRDQIEIKLCRRNNLAGMFIVHMTKGNHFAAKKWVGGGPMG